MKTETSEMSGVVVAVIKITGTTGDQMKTESQKVGIDVNGTNEDQSNGGQNMNTENSEMTGTMVEKVKAAMRKQEANRSQTRLQFFKTRHYGAT